MFTYRIFLSRQNHIEINTDHKFKEKKKLQKVSTQGSFIKRHTLKEHPMMTSFILVIKGNVEIKQYILCCQFAFICFNVN